MVHHNCIQVHPSHHTQSHRVVGQIILVTQWFRKILKNFEQNLRASTGKVVHRDFDSVLIHSGQQVVK